MGEGPSVANSSVSPLDSTPSSTLIPSRLPIGEWSDRPVDCHGNQQLNNPNVANICTKVEQHVYRIYPNKRPPRISAHSDGQKVVSAKHRISAPSPPLPFPLPPPQKKRNRKHPGRVRLTLFHLFQNKNKTSKLSPDSQNNQIFS